MTHLTRGDGDLHHEDGSHRSTPVSTSGTALVNHERRLRAHLAAHGIATSIVCNPEVTNARPEPANNYGTDGDHCPECGTDWKAPHDRECSQFHRCEFPPGCEKDAQFGRRLCPEHHAALSRLFAPAEP